jgi:hypothetical protein
MRSRLSGSSARPRVLALFAALVATAAAPDGISTIASAANLTLHNGNLPVFASTANRVVMNGEATRNARPGNVLDCSKAFVDFPGIDQSNPFGSTWAPSL